jgi:hypothetical protein
LYLARHLTTGFPSMLYWAEFDPYLKSICECESEGQGRHAFCQCYKKWENHAQCPRQRSERADRGQSPSASKLLKQNEFGFIKYNIQLKRGGSTWRIVGVSKEECSLHACLEDFDWLINSELSAITQISAETNRRCVAAPSCESTRDLVNNAVFPRDTQIGPPW